MDYKQILKLAEDFEHKAKTFSTFELKMLVNRHFVSEVQKKFGFPDSNTAAFFCHEKGIFKLIGDCFTEIDKIIEQTKL